MEFYSTVDYADDFENILAGATRFGDGVLGPLQDKLVSEYAAAKAFEVLDLDLKEADTIIGALSSFIMKEPGIRALRESKGTEPLMRFLFKGDCMEIVNASKGGDEFYKLGNKIFEHEMALAHLRPPKLPVVIKRVNRTVFVPFATYCSLSENDRIAGKHSLTDLADKYDIGLFLDDKLTCSHGFFDSAVRTIVPDRANSADRADSADSTDEILVPATEAQAALLTAACSSKLGRAVTVRSAGAIEGEWPENVTVAFPDSISITV